MKTMRAAVAREAGPPDSLTLDRLPVPELAPGRVLVAVRAVSINPVDYKMMSGAMGTPFPLVPGRDLAGTVAEVAEGVEEFAEGDLVFGAAAWGPAGSFAEFTVAEPGTLAKVPDGLAVEQAAALPTIVTTAHTALFDVGRIGSGTRVLIAGASGGVGGIAVQLAKQVGAYVVGAASSANRAYVLGLGADEFLAYDEDPEYASVRDITVAFDFVGGETTELAGRTLGSGGRLVTIANFETETLPSGVKVESMQAKPNPVALRKAGEAVVAGDLKLGVERVFSWEELPDALVRSASGRTRGKLVVTI